MNFNDRGVGSSNFLQKLGILALLLLILTPAFLFSSEVKATEGFYEKQFSWSYGDSDWTYNITISKSLYDTYKAVPVSQRTRNGPAGYGFLTTTNDPFIINIANGLHEASTKEGYGTFDEVSFVLAFVQSLRYTSDSSSAGYDEYPRFPIETLVDEVGDCEDTSILFATIISILDYGIIYINPPGHYAVGVKGSNDVVGTYWTYQDSRYYYCETTGENWRIGEIPQEFENQDAYIYAIDPSKQFVPGQSVAGSPSATNASAFDLSRLLDLRFLLPIVISCGVAVPAVVRYRRKKKMHSEKGRTMNEPFQYPLPPPPPDFSIQALSTQNLERQLAFIEASGEDKDFKLCITNKRLFVVDSLACGALFVPEISVIDDLLKKDKKYGYSITYGELSWACLNHDLLNDNLTIMSNRGWMQFMLSKQDSSQLSQLLPNVDALRGKFKINR